MKGWTWRHGSISTCDTWFHDVLFLWKHRWLHRHKCVKLHLDMPYLIFNWTSKKWKKRLSKRTKEGISWCQPRPGIRHPPHARRHEFTSKIFASKIFWCSFFPWNAYKWFDTIHRSSGKWLKTGIFHHGVSFLQGLRHDRHSTTRTISSTGVCAFQLSYIELHEVP